MATAFSTREEPAAAAALAVGVCAKEDGLRKRAEASLAQSGIDVSRSCADLEAALDAHWDRDLDVVVIAVERLDRAALDLIRALAKALPEVRAVVICTRSAAGDIRKALDAGASGVVLLDEIDEVLLPVLQTVVAGQVSVPGARGSEVGKRILTTREKQVLGLAVSGLTNAQIASQLFLAESTIKSHLSSSFAKLGVASRNEAAAFVLDPLRGRELGILLTTATASEGSPPASR